MVNLCLAFKTFKKSTVAYTKSFPIKRAVSISRAETTMLRAQTTTTRTAEIPTRPGSLYQLLVPQTQCQRWTKPQIHYSSNGKITTGTAELYLWHQNMH